MPTYSVGEAIRLVFEKSGWTQKSFEVALRNDWAELAGKTVAKYTSGLSLRNKVLVVQTSIPVLKQEILMNKEELMKTINEHYQAQIVTDVQVK